MYTARASLTCLMTLQQIDCILTTYIEEDEVPEWITKVMPEFDFIFQRDSRARVFFNVSSELRYMALLDNIKTINIGDLNELNYSRIPDNAIINVLERAFLIEKKGRDFIPGKLLEKLSDTRLYGYELNSPELQNTHREINSVISIALMKALIEDFNTYLPKGAIAVFNMLSDLILKNKHGKTSNTIDKRLVSKNFRIVSKRHFNHLAYSMVGNIDGRTRILQDIDENGEIICKECVLIYLDRMRERIRERTRERSL